MSSTSSSSGSVISSAFNLVLGHTSADGNHSWNGSLDLLQSDGMARVLAEPTLVALSGQSASFLSGGELPIPEPQGLGTTTIVYKPFGIGLTVTPTVLAPDRIALKVAPQASDLDYTNAVVLNGVSVPAITTRRADTTVELGDGETFIIGGLVSRSITSQVDKIPLLGDIPIIGAFFRDLNYSRQDKELVLIVTPHLVRPIAKGTPIPLPGEREERNNLPVWGSWLLNPAGSDQLPGFSR
jgi:pilus assembly protein CpaC